MNVLNMSIALTILMLGLALAIFGQTGKISGKLTYPSEGIPSDLVLCVKRYDLYAEPVYCSNERASRLKGANIAFRLRTRAAAYDITVPAGSYLVWAATADMPGVKAYHNEFIKCGMTVRCTSKAPVVIKVRKGQTVSGIKVGDFW
jgi:hypothetical protein